MTAPMLVPATRPSMAATTMRTSHAGADVRTSEIKFWRPPLKSVDAEVMADAAMVRARARDLVRNNGYAAHAVRISRIATVGANFRLRLKPDHEFLGISFEDSARWARMVERVWSVYSGGTHFWIDATRRSTFTDLMNLIHDQDFVDGETLVVVEWAENRPWKTCFQVVDVDRLSNPHGQPEAERFKGGVEIDDYGAPIAYHIRNGHPAAFGMQNPLASMTWSRVPRETDWNRPIAMHSFEPGRPGQTRGMSAFTSAIVALKMGAEYAEMELATATAQASIAAVLTSAANLVDAANALGDANRIDQETGEEIAASQAQFEQSIDYYNALDVRFNGVKVPKLAPGDKLDIVGSKHPTSAYASFVKHQLQGVAAGLGIDPIALSQDYSTANYASNKMSFAHNGRAAETRRARLIRTVALPMFGAWLEEAVAIGAVDMPPGLTPDQFYDARDALVRGTFVTSSRAMIEPARERQAQQMGLAMGVETLDSICAEEGEAWEDNLEQIAREKLYAAELGLSLPGIMPLYDPTQDAAADEDDDNEKPREPAQPGAA